MVLQPTGIINIVGIGTMDAIPILSTDFSLDFLCVVCSVVCTTDVFLRNNTNFKKFVI